MLPEDLNKKYDEFSKTVVNNNILDSKTTTMLYMAAAMAVGCYPWMAHLLGVAKEKGITEDEITVIQGIVMAVSGGRVRAQFHEVQTISSDKKTNIKDCV